jgi:hypothetical protein
MENVKEPAELVPQIPLTDLKVSLTLKVKEQFLCIITGLPGAGKSYITRSVMGRPELWVLVEQFGEDKGGKYIAKVPSERLSKAMIISGTADNFFDVVSEALRLKMDTQNGISLNGIALFYVMPDAKVFRQANALKAKADTPFSKYFKANSLLSEKAIERQAVRQLSLWMKKLTPIASSHDLTLYVAQVLNTWDGKAITKAWDEVKTTKVEKGGENA